MTDRTDYSGLRNVVSAKQKHKDEMVKTVNSDIGFIQNAISLDDEEQMKSVHMMIDGKYSSCISGFGKSLYCYNDKLGFNYDLIDKESLKHNLIMMQSKLQGYVCGFPINTVSPASQSNINVNVEVENDINICISFEEAKQKIDEMQGLTDAETEEIKAKIDALEKISNERISKKKKWDKIKPILIFALDKGIDVAIVIMSVILQSKLGT